MVHKVKLVKTIDINEEYTILIVKKTKEPQKFCKDCPHFKYFADLSLHYCDKHLYRSRYVIWLKNNSIH